MNAFRSLKIVYIFQWSESSSTEIAIFSAIFRCYRGERSAKRSPDLRAFPRAKESSRSPNWHISQLKRLESAANSLAVSASSRIPSCASRQNYSSALPGEQLIAFVYFPELHLKEPDYGCFLFKAPLCSSLVRSSVCSFVNLIEQQSVSRERKRWA